jgi:hypothetical protein
MLHYSHKPNHNSLFTFCINKYQCTLSFAKLTNEPKLIVLQKLIQLKIMHT